MTGMVRAIDRLLTSDRAYAWLVSIAAVMEAVGDVADLFKPDPTHQQGLSGLWIAVALLWWRQVEPRHRR